MKCKIPMDFWETLGQYVYGYVDKKGNFVYIGKGNKNRAVSHVKNKDYNLDDLIIIARNLERFRIEKPDLQSFILESFLISQNDPKDNSVAGHHKECFIMAKFSELFGVYVKSKHDNFMELPEWYVQNYEKIGGRDQLRVFTIKSHIHSLEFQTQMSLQPSLDVMTDESVTFKVAIWGKERDQGLQNLKKFCESVGIDGDSLVKEGVREFYVIDPDNMDFETAINFIDQFYS